MWATGVEVTRVALSVEEFSQREKDIKGGEKDQAVRMLRDQVEENKPAGVGRGRGVRRCWGAQSLRWKRIR